MATKRTRTKKTTNPADRFHLTRIPLDRHGYTKQGRYYGVGAPLFSYENKDYTISGELRAKDRADAKKKIREKIRNPRAVFTR